MPSGNPKGRNIKRVSILLFSLKRRTSNKISAVNKDIQTRSSSPCFPGSEHPWRSGFPFWETSRHRVCVSSKITKFLFLGKPWTPSQGLWNTPWSRSSKCLALMIISTFQPMYESFLNYNLNTNPMCLNKTHSNSEIRVRLHQTEDKYVAINILWPGLVRSATLDFKIRFIYTIWNKEKGKNLYLLGTYLKRGIPKHHTHSPT